MSGIDPSCFVEEEEVSSLRNELITMLFEKEPTSFKWTDEKHSLYLNCMEASFVHQLYDSMDVLSWQPMRQSNESSSRNADHTIHDQFKVCQSGCWEKKSSYDRARPHQPEGQHTNYVLVPNPYIRSFRAAEVLHPSSPPLSDAATLGGLSGNFKGNDALAQEGSNSGFSDTYPLTQLYFDSSNSDKEVSDQNFVKEDDKVLMEDRFYKPKWFRSNYPDHVPGVNKS